MPTPTFRKGTKVWLEAEIIETSDLGNIILKIGNGFFLMSDLHMGVICKNRGTNPGDWSSHDYFKTQAFRP